MRKVSGFTIIELVVVITILGILAAIALPKFFDVQTDARIAAGQGVAGAISSGSAMNYGTRLAKNQAPTAGAGPVFTVGACTTADLGNVLAGGLPAGYTVANGTSVTFAANGESNTCLIIPNGTPSGANVGTAVAVVIAVIN